MLELPMEVEYPWGPLILQLFQNGYFPSGPAMELYHGSGEKSIIKQHLTEMRIPILKFEDGTVRCLDEDELPVELPEVDKKLMKDIISHLTSPLHDPQLFLCL